MNNDLHGSPQLSPLPEFERALQQVRQNSLIATRKGDFGMVAKLTDEVVRLNGLMFEAQSKARQQTVQLPPCASNQQQP